MKCILKSNSASETISVQTGEHIQYVFLYTENAVPVGLTFNLEREATVEAVIIVVGHDRSDINVTVTINHAAHSTSQVNVRAVMDGTSCHTFNGNIIIPRGSVGANTSLTHRALLLSPEARVKVTPALEILENDVQARHAATQSRVNEDQLFYLASRGIRREEAEHLLVEGFIIEAVYSIADDNTRQQVMERLFT